MIPVFKPLIGDAEKQAAIAALDLGWLGMGSYVQEFERALESFLEVGDSRHVVALSTGHAALHLGLLLAGVGPGDEVITPSFNNVSDFQAIIACGADPVFCDIDPVTLCLDLNSAARLVSSRTKAIIAMDYDCILCDHDALADFAARHGLRVLHDAAHSLGSRYQGKMIGSFSDLAMFSFDPVKTITTIEGGALVVRSEADLARLHEMRLIGMTQPSRTLYTNERAWTYDVVRLGFRYHMPNMHAAIGLAQLSAFDRIAATRRRAAKYYNAGLREISSLKVPATDFDDDICPFLYYIRVPAELRAGLRAHLRAEGVDTGIHWVPGHRYSLFADCRRDELPVTDLIADEILSLPFHSDMSVETLERVVTAIQSFMKNPHVDLA
jgi:dTDP-4-amino-4,6-dideoxygalactose transaminase